MDCIFCKIARGEIKSEIVYADDEVVAFKDIRPQAPVHVLVINRTHTANNHETIAADPALFAALFKGVQKVAEITGVAESGYRTIINSGPDSGQEVFHVHAHVLGGGFMGPLVWKP